MMLMGCRYPYESVISIPQKPLYFTERYLNVKKVLTNTFYGPPKEGKYSPSVQSTLYDMAKTVLKRSRSQISLTIPSIPSSLSRAPVHTSQSMHAFHYTCSTLLNISNY